MNTSRSEGQNIRYWLTVVSSRRWVIIASFCLTVIAGIILSLKLPKVYEASTLILVQPQRVPEKIVTPVVTTGLENRINTISQEILSRSNLERVIEKFALFTGPNQQDMFTEDKIADLRNRIKVEVSRTKTKSDAEAFTIVYQDRDPQKAMRVANGLAAFFIDENLKDREIRAVGTSDFLEAELDTMRRRLEAQEQILIKFREKNMGELPEQLDANLKILERLNQQLSQKEESLRSARVSLVALENESIARQNALSAAVVAIQPQTGRESEDTMSLEQLRAKLDALRGSYTEQHPDVVRLRSKIERMQAEAAANRQSGSSEPKSAFEASAAATPETVRQKMLIQGQIENLQVQIAHVNQDIREYQRRVEATPRREQELLTLRRDYDNIKASYNSLLNRKLEADISVNMEKKQKGEQFQIIDVARLPTKPIFPDPRKLFLATIFAGLGISVGLVVLLDKMDTSVRRIENFEEVFGMIVLANVPRIFTRRDKTRHHIRQAATAVSILVAIGLTAGLAVICFMGGGAGVAM